MAVFLNGQRQSLWTDKPLNRDDEPLNKDDEPLNRDDEPLASSDEELKEDAFSENKDHGTWQEKKLKSIEKELQNIICNGIFVHEEAEFLYRRQYRICCDRVSERRLPGPQEQKNFARYHNELLVPKNSTQELCAVLQLSALARPEDQMSKPFDAQTHRNLRNSQQLGEKEKETRIRKIQHEQGNLAEVVKQLSSDVPDARSDNRIGELIRKYHDLGRACATVDWVGDARYYLFTAQLLAEMYKKLFLCSPAERHNIRLTYAKFLNNNGWHSEALEIMEDLFRILSKKPSQAEGISGFSKKVEIRLASMFLQTGDFEKAANRYKALAFGEKDLSEIRRDAPLKHNIIPQFLEKAAWAQVHQGKNDEAHSYYALLSEQSSPSPTILCNLGFLSIKLGRFPEAKKFYERALQQFASGNVPTVNESSARSGLYTCLRQLGTSSEDISRALALSVGYVDINSSLANSPFFRPPFQDGPLSFAIARHLESLLSLGSISVEGTKKISGVAFVDADPLILACQGRYTYFQFKFLVQCQKYINAMPDRGSSQLENAHRIQKTCKGHLIWAFKIAKYADTWTILHEINSAKVTSVPSSSEPSSKSRSVEGAWQFLKLCLYLKAWPDEWHFVLELLNHKIEEWLTYLAKTQHMANLWVERDEVENLRPYNTISRDDRDINKVFPQYHLSDSALLWLALSQLEQIIQMIERKFESPIEQHDASIESMIRAVREYHDSFQDTLSPQKIRLSIFNTFKISKRQYSNEEITDEKASSSLGAAAFGKSQAPAVPKLPGKPSTAVDQRIQEEKQATTTSKSDQQVILLQRTTNAYITEIEATDIATVDAANAGIFEEDNVKAAWQETLGIQEEKDVSTFEDTLHMALALFASCSTSKYDFNLARSPDGKVKEALCERLQNALYDSGSIAQFIEEDIPQAMRSWSAVTYESLSLIVDSLFSQCRIAFSSQNSAEDRQPSVHSQRQLSLQEIRPKVPRRVTIMVPDDVDTSSRKTPRNVIDKGFLPDWMYYYPEFIHTQSLDIKSHDELKPYHGLKSLKPLLDTWKALGNFSEKPNWDMPFFPAVVDSGKKSTRSDDSFAERQMDIDYYIHGSSFCDRLCQPRCPDKARKRLIEVSSREKESALICWLTASPKEKDPLLEFLRRHETLENFFGECAHWKGNIWETEFHLGFHQLIHSEDNAHSTGWHGQLRVRDMPSLSATAHRRRVLPVVMSIRFIGDLRDRYWTCYFFSSLTRDDAFKGLVDGWYNSSDTREKFYKEKQGQRKILELVYVERMLNEVARSIYEISCEFQKEFDLFESQDQQSESLESNNNYIVLQRRATEILRDVSRQLDSSIYAIEEWEKREETRGLRSRWSAKDEQRYGERLRGLRRNCKFNIQRIRTEKSRLEEQKRFAEQRYSELVSYMQLREARISTQSAEDVRLFTYVTIVFLPLSFSSSLFSMQGPPGSHTIFIMSLTTTTALAVTVFFLSNLKLLERNWSFQLKKLYTNAREKTKRSQHSWAFQWNDIAIDLDEAARQRLRKLDDDKHLPKESQWYYIIFWLSSIFKMPRVYVINGLTELQRSHGLSLYLAMNLLRASLFAPVCVFIFLLQLLFTLVIDTLDLLWRLTRRHGKKILSPPQTEKRPEVAADKKIKRRSSEKADEKDTGSSPDVGVARYDTGNVSRDPSPIRPGIQVVKGMSEWLKSPPRPIRDHMPKAVATADTLQSKESESPDSESDSDDVSSIHSHELASDKDEDLDDLANINGVNNEASTSSHLVSGSSLKASKTNDFPLEESASSWWKRSRNVKKNRMDASNEHRMDEGALV
ncbi:MAG: hypothetical protein Q9201_006827 [Fulgogasparrea decipioides]